MLQNNTFNKMNESKTQTATVSYPDHLGKNVFILTCVCFYLSSFGLPSLNKDSDGISYLILVTSTFTVAGVAYLYINYCRRQHAVPITNVSHTTPVSVPCSISIQKDESAM